MVPDILNGDSRSPETLADPNFDRAKWLAAHGPDSWEPVVDAVVEALTKEGVTRFGTTGYCFGAPPAFYLAYKNAAHVTVLTHPSRLDCPADLEVCSGDRVGRTCLLMHRGRNTRPCRKHPS